MHRKDLLWNGIENMGGLMLLKLNALIVVLPILQEKTLNKLILGLGAKNGDLNVLVRDAENFSFISIISIILNWMAFGSMHKARPYGCNGFAI